MPNLLTYLRLLAVPGFVAAYAAGQASLALALFAGAAVTDGLDGLLARVLDQRTRLGSYLDPFADKLLTSVALVTLVVAGSLPGWLLGLVVFRDGGILLAVAVLKATGRPVPAAPTRLGKYATFYLVLTLVLALARDAHPSEALQAWLVVVALLAAQCVVGSTVQYFARWRRLMRMPPWQ